MKYKNINSMLHNFGHSFCSDMNMVIQHEKFCGFIFQELNRFFQSHPEQGIRINFSTGKVAPLNFVTPEFLASIENYRSWLRNHCAKHDIDHSLLSEVILEFTKAPTTSGKSFRCEASCIDDRGKSYSSPVNLN